MKETAIRELSEEAGIFLKEDQIDKMGILHFFYKANPSRDQDVHIYSGTYD